MRKQADIGILKEGPAVEQYCWARPVVADIATSVRLRHSRWRGLCDGIASVTADGAASVAVCV